MEHRLLGWKKLCLSKRARLMLLKSTFSIVAMKYGDQGGWHMKNVQGTHGWAYGKVLAWGQKGSYTIST